ncbi:hypothetical protein KY348_01620 [Candidatus Woesearchaeota archaeon]|nr:hypothetical protein [Candidatus Woesearchaeota archaeon]
MQETEDNVEEIKEKLRRYKRQDLIFNEPHFSYRLILREGSKEEVIKNLLKPDNLVYSYKQKGSLGDIIHCLHFKISNKRTMRLPVIFKKKTLYILTYIMRYRPWQSMIKRRRR